MAIMKCDAYGNGAIEVSRQALNLGVKALGVSSLYEGIAVLIGKQGNEEITATEIARMAGTIPYEIFTSINKRVQRVYSDKD